MHAFDEKGIAQQAAFAGRGAVTAHEGKQAGQRSSQFAVGTGPHE
jgi:hypothetical protein